MPFYGFVCPKCGAVAEDIRSIADYDLPIVCTGKAIYSENREAYAVEGGRKHAPVGMVHSVNRFTPIVKGGTRYA
jgi:hypothetical protein